MRANPTHAILKSGSVHASMIDGGAEWSSYPARCRISLERRTIPGETPLSVQRELLRLGAKRRQCGRQSDAVGLKRNPDIGPEQRDC
jgi:acetylornithine deacetylase